MNQFDLILPNADTAMLYAPGPNYRLVATKKPPTRVSTKLRTEEVYFKTAAAVITGRDLDEYRQQFPELPLDPTKRVIEIGPGLAEYIPALTKLQPQERPIAIDPIDYALIKAMLEEALHRAVQAPIFQDVHARLTELLERADIFLDASKIEHIPMTLGEALRSRPDLHGTGDIVIDSHGPTQYLETEGGPLWIKTTQEVRQRIHTIQLLEQLLLK